MTNASSWSGKLSAYDLPASFPRYLEAMSLIASYLSASLSVFSSTGPSAVTYLYGSASSWIHNVAKP